MFNFFGKKPKLVREDDKIYMYRRITDQVLVTDAIAAAQGTNLVIISSFFGASLQRMENLLRARSFPCAVLNIHDLPALPLNGVPALFLLDARQIVSNLSLQSWLMKPQCSFRFLFTEHYPIFSAEQQALDILEQASQESQQQVRFYAGLDDRLFQVFGGNNIMQLMHKMGMRDDEVITHPMVTKSIANAQKKIEKKVTHEFTASGEEDWFQKNMPH
ncbi:MAG: secA [Bacteroidetes bacterium]|nr:MAG: secA [Bacteroidota bacterium]